MAKMTKADQIRKLRARGLSIDKIAERLGMKRAYVQTQFWVDDNPKRTRELRREWQRKERRENPEYYARELKAMRERYHRDPALRKRMAAYTVLWKKRNRERYRAYQAAYQRARRAEGAST